MQVIDVLLVFTGFLAKIVAMPAARCFFSNKRENSCRLWLSAVACYPEVTRRTTLGRIWFFLNRGHFFHEACAEVRSKQVRNKKVTSKKQSREQTPDIN